MQYDSSPKYSLLEAKQKLEAFCAYQERCDFEIRKKLRDWNMHSEDIDVLIADLIVNNFLNEERFAEAYVSGKFRIKRWGKLKIKRELKFRKISDYSINKAMTQIADDAYEQTIKDLIAYKMSGIARLKSNVFWLLKATKIGLLMNY